jgi:SAM-dependent MidA family methyltransferase
VAQAIDAAAGWIGFDAFMALALYEPGLGYYARDARQFGLIAGPGGGDFATAPEISPLFGRAVAAQVAQALEATQTDEVWEFGAGSGALALQMLQALPALRRYTIVDLSGSLRLRQRQTLAPFADKVRWVSALPDQMQGVVLGNEVLDAMPVRLLMRRAGQWFERGVALDGGQLVWAERSTELRPPVEIEGEHDYLSEIHPQGEAFVRTLADKLTQGAAFFIDYGFPESEYYHPQRSGGTVMCHRGHMADADPLQDPGEKDITAHVNFSAIALAGQDAGLQVLGYATQARFLMNCGLLNLLEGSSLAERAMAQKLLTEHEMGELFKVIGFAAGNWEASPWEALGFMAGDRTQTL